MPRAANVLFKVPSQFNSVKLPSQEKMTLDNMYAPASTAVFQKALRPSIRRERLVAITAFVAGFLVCHLFLTSGSAIQNGLFDKGSARSFAPAPQPNQYPYAPPPYAMPPQYMPPYGAPIAAASNPQPVVTNAAAVVAQPPQAASVPAPVSPFSSSLRYCEDTSRNNGPCIFDIGHNNGQDTRDYLNEHPNSRVVAIEANPTLVAESKVKFADAIAADRLKLIGIGITAIDPKKENTVRPKLKFYVNQNDKFSSFVENLGCRNYTGEVTAPGDRTFCSVMELDTRTCGDLVREYGTPIYFKIDIEGKDRACLESLEVLTESDRPKYTSIENVTELDIDILLRLGYKKFKVVNQNVLQQGVSDEVEGHSGPWGEDAVDAFTGKRWQTADEVKNRLPLTTKMVLDGKELHAWYDLHASK
ncbi:methyltransferase FkbM family [Gracilaria domingensis]|nr:methyltransferase FkbM family [Gracilaria domingensis]